jgi:hypothetical protein
MFFMPSCLLMLGIAAGAAWTLNHETTLRRAIERGIQGGRGVRRRVHEVHAG